MRLDNFGPSLGVMVLGMIIVFIGLAVLIVATRLLSSIMGQKKQAEKLAGQAAPPAQAAPATETIPLPVIAAITAAIMACENGSGKTLVVRSVRRANAWASAGRQESINY